MEKCLTLVVWMAVGLFALCACSTTSRPQTSKPIENIVLITIDGLRWQEVFRGVDHRLLNAEAFIKRKAILEEQFVNSVTTPQAALLPFLTQTMATNGILYGNRDVGECMKVTNPWYFSYPGYSEILTGVADPKIDSNKKFNNPNVTFLEYLNLSSPFKGQVAAFGSWDVFPYIMNTERSGIPVNAGFDEATLNPTQKELWLNTLQHDIPSPWETVRLDAFTHHYALETIQKTRPRALYIAYGETDDFAHDGHYDQYILAAHRTDRFIREIWTTLQAIPQYQNKTVLLVTTDHGRGEMPLETWQHHASQKSLQGYMKSLSQYQEGIVGSDNVWLAAMGPGVGTMPKLQDSKACYGSNQIAATLLAALGINPNEFNTEIGEAMPIVEVFQ